MRRTRTKQRDMARSILPSSGRQRARKDKARIKRAARRAITQELAAVAFLNDPDEWDEAGDLRREPSQSIRYVVLGRRSKDKLNHFERWAIVVTRHLPIEDRLPRLRGQLPKGLIGDHAMSHLERRPELNPRLERVHWRVARDEHRHALRDGRHRGRLAVEQAVRLIMDTGGHKDLNMAMKAAFAEPSAVCSGHEHVLVRYDADVGRFAAELLAHERACNCNKRRLQRVIELASSISQTERPYE